MLLCVACCFLFFKPTFASIDFYHDDNKIRLIARQELEIKDFINSDDVKMVLENKIKIDAFKALSDFIISHRAAYDWRDNSLYLMALCEFMFKPEVLVVHEKNKIKASLIIVYNFDEKELIDLAQNEEHNQVLQLITNIYEDLLELTNDINLQELKEENSQDITKIASEIKANFSYLEFLRRFPPQSWSKTKNLREEVEKILKIDKDHAEANMNVAQILLADNFPNEALKYINKSLSLDIDFGMFYYVRGLIHLQSHLPALAVHDFSQALEKKFDKNLILSSRGTAYHMQNDFDAMCNDFHELCAIGDCSWLSQARALDNCVNKNIN